MLRRHRPLEHKHDNIQFDATMRVAQPLRSIHMFHLNPGQAYKQRLPYVQSRFPADTATDGNAVARGAWQWVES